MFGTAEWIALEIAVGILLFLLLAYILGSLIQPKRSVTETNWKPVNDPKELTWGAIKLEYTYTKFE